MNDSNNIEVMRENIKELYTKIGEAADSKVKILEINSPLTEARLLDVLMYNEGYECFGFFYNSDQDVYCEFEGLYSGHKIGSEVVHFGYCHIRGIHNSTYSVDYYIDDEDGSTWYKKTPADYIETELNDIDTMLDDLATKIGDTDTLPSPDADLCTNISEVNSKLPQYTDLTYAISGLNANGTTRQNQSLSIPTGKNVLGATIISVPDNDWWTASVTNLSNTSCKIIVQNWGSSVTSGNVKVRVAFS